MHAENIYVHKKKKKGGDREDPGSLTAHLHLCIFCVVSCKWSLLPNPFATSVRSVLLGRQNCTRHSQGQSIWLVRTLPKECLQKRRVGGTTLVLYSLGNQCCCVRNKWQTVPRIWTQAQRRKPVEPTEMKRRHLKAHAHSRVQSQMPYDTYWAGIHHSCDNAKPLSLLCAPSEILYPCLHCQGEQHAELDTKQQSFLKRGSSLQQTDCSLIHQANWSSAESIYCSTEKWDVWHHSSP